MLNEVNSSQKRIWATAKPKNQKEKKKIHIVALNIGYN